jgi:hypothetical protein
MKKNYLHGINKHLEAILIASKTNLRKFDLNEDLKQLRLFCPNQLKLYYNNISK